MSDWGARIVYKNPGDEGKIDGLDIRLQVLIGIFRLFADAKTQPTIVVTDIDTLGVHQIGGPHYRHQAIDFRPIGERQTLEFANWINRVFDYGRGYKVALFGELDPNRKHDDHLHLQVPPPLQLTGKIPLYRLV